MYPVKRTHEFSTIPECGHSKRLHAPNSIFGDIEQLQVEGAEAKVIDR